MTLLEGRSLSIAFGGVHAVQNISLEVAQGDLVGLIGPNGAGKTTLLRLLTGLARPDSGRVLFEGRDITRLPIHVRVKLGLALTHQIVRPFRDMTLAENVTIAARSLAPWAAFTKIRIEDERRRALGLLERLGIADAADKPARSVPLGYLKRLEVARSLALEPRLLLLDEPLAGLNYAEAARLADVVVELNATGITIVLVEHNLGEVTRIARRLLVMHNGALLAEGEPRAVMARPDVRDAYLGAATHA